ncbi:MAG: bifunctional folylpolyglutamate synthase/dihydrofolate synthase [Acidobacteria bacterium]|nr:MAG: bifunctional folylpolyglutamate synthase/dihydrofolate synthase [Acidobacteriota bacterium]
MPTRTPRRRARAAAYLSSRVRFGIKFGLETMRALCEELQHPERAFPTLLVAGTNGKGSVVAYADAALCASGLVVGRYTSPHLVRVHERIAVGGRDVGPAAFEAAVERVRRAAESLVGSRAIPAHPTYFEVLTAAGLDHFRRERVDVAVLEVGMGGRLDATNVVAPLASAIVSVEKDHEAYLGSTLGAIAHEKAGVLRAGRATVLGPLPSEAHETVALDAAAMGARLVEARAGVTVDETPDGLGIRTPGFTYRGVRTLAGAHQRDNALVALRLLEEARAAGLAVDLSAAAAALGATRWPGRLERVVDHGRVPLLLDGAHNPAAARALAAYLAQEPPFVLLFGVMADKDVETMTRVLFPLAQAVVLTRAPSDRAAAPEEIARRAGAVARGARVAESPRRALALARRLAPPGGQVVVAGSLYLVGEVTRILRTKRRA